MNIRSLNAELLRQLSYIADDEECLEQVLEAVNDVVERKRRAEAAPSDGKLSPCAYTLEEVKQRLRATEADAVAGRGLSEEEADRLIDAMV